MHHMSDACLSDSINVFCVLEKQGSPDKALSYFPADSIGSLFNKL